MKSYKSILTLIILVTSAHFCIAGGGWPQPKGSTYLKLNQWWVISDQHYTGTGMIDPHLTRGMYNTSIYGEYGITDRITGIIYFPFFCRATLNEQVSGTTGQTISEGDAINSVGDADISLKYGLIVDKPVVLSATVTFGLPTGNSSGGRDGSLQTGDGEFNQMISFDLSKSFKVGNLYPFATISAGFNNRTNGFSDEFRYGLEAGITLNKLTLIMRFNGIESFQNGEENFNASGTSLFANNAEFLSYSPEIAYSITDSFGVSMSYGGALSGKLIYANPSYAIGLFLKL